MRRSRVQSSRPETSNHTLFWVDFITITSGSRFSVHTPMPTNERLWTDDRDDLQNRRKPSIQLDKEHAIAVRKPHAPMHYPAQHNHLVPERSIFGFKLARRLKWRDQDVKDKA